MLEELEAAGTVRDPHRPRLRLTMDREGIPRAGG